MKPVVFFDTETTGLDTTNDRIVELYMNKCWLDGSGKTEELHLFINPGRPMPVEAYNVHHISDEQLANCPKFAEVAQQVADFIKDCYLCGHNSNKYDVLLLAEELGRAKVDYVFDKSMLLDTLQVERQLRSHSLIATYKRYFGHDYSEDIGDAHGAKADTLATMKVFLAQTAELDIEGDDMLTQYREAGKPNDAEVDLSGHIVKGSDGEYYYNFGKNKGRRVKDDPQYAMWMLNSTFPANTKQCIRKIIHEL